MDAVYTVGQEVHNLIDGIGDSGIAQGGIVMTVPGQDFLELQRKGSPAKSDHPFNLFLVGDGHDTRFDRDADSSLGRFVEEIVKIVVIEEQLCNEFAGTGIDFDFQMFHVFCQCFGIGVAFGIAGADNVEFIPCLLTDKSDEVAGIGEIRVWVRYRAFYHRAGPEYFQYRVPAVSAVYPALPLYRD